MVLSSLWVFDINVVILCGKGRLSSEMSPKNMKEMVINHNLIEFILKDNYLKF